MRIAVIGGTGYVGLVTGIGLAAHGNRVICADIDEKKINNMKNGILPIYEEGLQELLDKARTDGEISFTCCLRTAVCESDIILIAVGTPENKYGDADMTHLLRALKTVAGCLNSYKVIAVKSTVPVGTCQMARQFIRNNLKNAAVEFDVVSNPEFLREGSAVRDFLYPDRIVIGADSTRAAEAMKELYRTFETPLVVTDVRSSEMIKYACNSYLATRISFINEIAEICEKVDADINSVICGMKYDKRIGASYLSPGPGFGGPCLSKDIKSLINFSSKSGANVDMLKSVLRRNEVQITNIINYINNTLKGMRSRRVAVLGLSFKAGTNDTRNSPAFYLLEQLVEAGMETIAYDPVVKQLEEALKSQVVLAGSIREAASNADCLVVMTEWDEFSGMDLRETYLAMRTPIIVDTRNIIPAREAYREGFIYRGIGIGQGACEDALAIPRLLSYTVNL